MNWKSGLLVGALSALICPMATAQDSQPVGPYTDF
jgi:hypothetical protein